MPYRRKSSIRQQLTTVVLFTSFLGLGIACTAIELYERASFRSELIEEVGALADTVGANSAASLTFEDHKAAEETLAGLRTEPHIVEACIYDGKGSVFGEYRRGGNQGVRRLEFQAGEGAEFTAEALTLRRDIYLGGERIGEIAIVYELSGYHAKMRRYTAISALVLVFSVLATLLISARLLNAITAPILALAALAARVTKEKDYTLRAVAYRDDEVAKLVDSFNEMLGRVQERDTALQEAKDGLERRVEQRTAELQREVQERIQAEEQLQKSLKELEDLKFALDQHCIVARTDARGVITSVNEKFCTVSKYAPEELIGQTHKIVNSGHHARKFFDELWETISSGQTWRGEIKNLTKDGNPYWVDTTIVPFRGANGRPFQYIAIRMDITNLKRIEEELRAAKDVAEQASRAKSGFLANMSHEIRTPLNGIMGMTDLTLDTQLTPEQRDYLETVKNSSDSLLTVINDILDFSKIEAGKLDLENAEFDLREVMESTLKTLAVRAGEKKLELLCEIAPDVPEMVRGDAVRLRQVLTNLTGNAIKFTEHGEVALRVIKEAGSEQEPMLRFTVADTGVGILASKLDLIFDPFSQADTSTTRKYGGTGLGLTISSRLVQMMGGKIWVESEVGRGSQFHFTVKLEASGSKEGRAIRNQAAEKLRGVRVLLVDDNPTNRRILDAMLRNWGMAPVCAESGEQALVKLRSAGEAGEALPMVLTDMQMPEMNGFELVERIRQMPGSHTATIVMLSSAGGGGDRERSRELGVAAYLLKPIRQAELRETITRVMGFGKEAMHPQGVKRRRRKGGMRRRVCACWWRKITR
jgi:PAS domain S-box-containing protein